MILFSLVTGRAPSTKRLNLESAGVELDRKTGAVKVSCNQFNITYCNFPLVIVGNVMISG